MMLHEAVQRIIERPDFVAIGVRDLMLGLNPGGFLVHVNKAPRNAYVRLRASDLQAMTWQVYTLDQIEQMARGAE